MENKCTLDYCDRPIKAVGLCDGHYRHKNQGKEPHPFRTWKKRPPRTTPVIPRDRRSYLERFNDSFTKTEGCWEWQGHIAKHGYGSLSVKGVSTMAHRLAYQLHTGEDCKGKIIDHMCHNRKCVNPEHLRVVTHKQNMEHRESATKASRTGVRGVSWYAPLGKYSARVTHNHKQYHLGYFESVEEAEKVVVAKRNELFTHNDKDKV